MPPAPPDPPDSNPDDSVTTVFPTGGPPGLAGVRSVAVPPKPEPLRRSNPTIVFNPDDFDMGGDVPPGSPPVPSAPPPVPSTASSSGPPPLPSSGPPPVPSSGPPPVPSSGPPPPPLRESDAELAATVPREAAPTESISQPLVAAISFFVPGGGQVYMGQTVKGLVIFGVACFTLGFCGLLNLVAAADAWKLAERKNRGETLGDWQFF